MPAKRSEKFLKIFCIACAALSIGAILCICLFVFVQGLPAISKIGFKDFFLGTIWQPGSGYYGILPMICGTLAVTGLAVLFGFPLGVLCAVYMVFECPKKLYPLLYQAIMLMAGIPSVVYGFFGLTTLVPFIRTTFGGHGMSLLAASLLLGFMILPTVASISLTSIKNAAPNVYDASRALGASHERSIFFAVLPAAKEGIFASLVLGLGRAAGETMAVLMVAGNQPAMPSGLLNGVRTLTTNIALEMGYAAGLQKEALIAGGGILLLLILLLNIGLYVFQKRRNHS